MSSRPFQSSGTPHTTRFGPTPDVLYTAVLGAFARLFLPVKHYSQYCFIKPVTNDDRLCMRLYDTHGRRKYLTPLERDDFLRAARRAPADVRTFCETLTYSGCRISEALALSPSRVDLTDGVLIFETLKKRRRGVYRAVPVPPAFLDTLDRVHGIHAARRLPDQGARLYLWGWSRTTAWRRVRDVMAAASISGLPATPKGLRHGFGIKAVASNVPLNMTQRWLGHARISTTSIYTEAVGAEEKEIAQRMWD